MSAQSASFSISSADSNGKFTISWTGVRTSVSISEKVGSTWRTVVGSTQSGSKDFTRGAGSYTFNMMDCLNYTTPYTTVNDCKQVAAQSITVIAKPGSSPSLSTATNDSDGSFSLTWSGIPGATSYKWRERENGGGWGSAVTAANSGVPRNKTNGVWGYQLAACNSVGCAGFGTEKSINVALKPGAPSAIYITPEETAGKLTISWGTASGSVSHYELQESSNGGSSYSNTFTIDVSLPKEKVRTKDPGTYRYRVRACRKSGSYKNCSGWKVSDSVVVPTTTFTVPATSSQATFSLSWSGARTYAKVEEINGPTVTSHGGKSGSVNVTRSNGTYTYRLIDCVTYTNPYGVPGESCAQAAEKTIVVAAPPQGVPTITSASNDANGDFYVKWNSVDDATRYAWTEKLTTSSSTQSGSTSNLQIKPSIKGNGTWVYTVQACNAHGCAGDKATTSVNVAIAPAIPSSIKITPALESNNYTVSWLANDSSTTSYYLEESKNGAGFKKVTLQNPTSLSKSFDNSYGTYSYRVSACRATGNYTSCSNPIDSEAILVTSTTFNVETTSTDGEIALYWSGAETYAIIKDISPGNEQTLKARGATQGSTTVIRSNGTYSFEFTACAEYVNPYGTSGTGCGSRKVKTITVSVPAPIITASFDSSSIYEGTNAQLSWNATKADSCTVSGLPGVAVQTGLSGSLIYTAPTEINNEFNVTAEINCSGLGGNTSKVVALAVNRLIGVPEESISSEIQAPVVASASLVSIEEQNATDQVGVIAGSFRVSEMGAATYSIPITLAAGTAGVTPQLSVGYSSGAGNGLLGQGWNLGGLSSISRCRQTLHQDAQVQPITWNNTDRFCLNGQRLLVQDGAVYGEVDSTYKTEIDSFVLVTAHGGAAGSPDYFTVQAKDGSTTTYGGAGASVSEQRVYSEAGEQQDKILSWFIQKFEDSVGNPIRYIYESTAEHHQLSEIRYAYGSSVDDTNAYNAKVTLNYGESARVDASQAYVGGYAVKNDSLLHGITAYSNNESIREYKFNYGDYKQSWRQGAGYQLQSVEECVGSVCLPKTEFSWEAESTASEYSEADTNPLYGPPLFLDALLQNGYADFDGDGVSDLYLIYQRNGDCYLRAAGVSFLQQSCAGDNKIFPLDYNMDGRADLIVQNDSRTRLYLSTLDDNKAWTISEQSVADVSLPSGEYEAVADIDGDGMVDILAHIEDDHQNYSAYSLINNTNASGDIPPYVFSATGTSISVDTSSLPMLEGFSQNSWSLGPHPSSVQADFNGDGQLDLVLVGAYLKEYDWTLADPAPQKVYGRAIFTFIRSAGQYVYYGQAEVTADGYSQRTVSAATDIEDILYPDRAGRQGIFIDVNGDGLTDVLGVSEYQLNTGSGFGARVDSGLTWGPENVAVDFNRDGHIDILSHIDRSNAGTTSTHRYLSAWNPSTKTYDIDARIDARPATNVSFESYADVNGDGWLDLVSYDYAEGKFTYNNHAAAGLYPQNILKTITNGLGNTTEIQYETLSTSPAYTSLRGVNESETDIEQCDLVQNVYGSGHSAEICTNVAVNTLNVLDFMEQKSNPLWWLPEEAQQLSLQEKMPLIEAAAPLFVVTNVTSSSPTAADTEATAGVAYFYHHLRVQAGGRGMLGFEKLATVDLQTGTRTTTQYRQDWPFIGMPQNTEVRSAAGHLLSRSTSNYKAVGLDNYTAANIFAQGTQTAGALQVYAQTSEQTAYALLANGTAQGEAVKTLVTTSQQDSYGNVEQLSTDTYAGDKTGAAFVSTETINTYGETNDEKFLGRLSASTVTTTRPDATPSTTGSRTSTFSYYDLSGSCTSSEHGAGANLEGLLCDETVAGGATVRHYYDLFGNATFTQSFSAIEGEGSRVSSYTQYDDIGRYAAATYTAYNAEAVTGPAEGVSSVYSAAVAAIPGAAVVKTSQIPEGERNKFGAPTQSQAYTGDRWLTSYMAYTPFGNLYFTASDSGGYKASTATTASTQCPTVTRYVTRERAAGGGESKVCHDVLGRAVRSLKKGFDGEWIKTDTDYNNMGQVVRSSEPYTGEQASYWTTVTGYDLLGRVKASLLPTGATTSVSYDDLLLTTTYTNPLDQIKVEGRNVLGEITGVTEGTTATAHYQFDLYGNLTKLKDPAQNETDITYNDLGQKESMNDPDKGAWQYFYNGFGELYCQQDAKGQIIKNQYDFAGRLIARQDYTAGSCVNPTGLKGNAQWQYDTASNGLGQLALEKDLTSGYIQQPYYDNFARVKTVATTLPGDALQATETHYAKTVYDQYGRVFQNFDAARDGENFDTNGTQNKYNNYGYLESIRNADENAPDGERVYYQIDTVNARGQVEEATLADGAMNISKSYFSDSGLVHEIQTLEGGLLPLQHLVMEWDVAGNLESREDYGLNENLDIQTREQSESFTYDGHNRLETYTVNGVTITVAYDDIGNITSKSDMENGATYNYGNEAGPHAVTSIGGKGYRYDANGNMINDDRGRILNYSVFEKVEHLSKGSRTTSFEYGTGRNRYKRIDENEETGTSSVTLYLGSVEKIYHSDKTREWKRTVAGGVQITQKFDSSGYAGRETHYLLKDHLGSVNLITDHTAEIKQLMAFDPWGARRDMTDWKASAVASIANIYTSSLPFEVSFYKDQKPITTRGFTSHEMVDEMEIIHMNGRIYDAKIGRFLQADPVIQAPTKIASLNRYSYVWNNPLNATDPSGFNVFSDAWKSIKPFAGIILGAILVVATAGGAALASSWFLQSAGHAALLGGITGGVGAAANGGNVLKGIAFGALSGAAFYGVGSMFDTGGTLAGLAGGVKEFAQAGMHGLVGGVLAELQGGEFGHGFLAAGIAKGFSLGAAAMTDNVVAQFMAATLAGGTVSEMTGGKFSNGAQTAALAFAVNQAASGATKGIKDAAQKDETEQQRMGRLLNNVYEDYPELKKLNIQVRAVDDIDGAVGLYQGGRRIDIKAGLGDIGTQATIFHEALHVDESVATTLFEGKWEYGLKETLGPSHFMQHDPWIDKAGSQYQHYLNFNGRLPDVNKPNLNDAPWRK
ncbi:SpvB/TcaC N-terminal domain-containing protein [Teredinibacter franksiae]|uniref:SpvB/TcaC N-terminal domain-containing protein n=1 Tax=Teredinibacter franksiae TaxID=2761453 RepID=UPI001625A915|nr:SpvB/TcaC N-terminal domain-containing protein [Teredinibacter franksiae]